MHTHGGDLPGELLRDLKGMNVIWPALAREAKPRRGLFSFLDTLTSLLSIFLTRLSVGHLPRLL